MKRGKIFLSSECVISRQKDEDQANFSAPRITDFPENRNNKTTPSLYIELLRRDQKDRRNDSRTLFGVRILKSEWRCLQPTARARQWVVHFPGKAVWPVATRGQQRAAPGEDAPDGGTAGHQGDLLRPLHQGRERGPPFISGRYASQDACSQTALCGVYIQGVLAVKPESRRSHP